MTIFHDLWGPHREGNNAGPEEAIRVEYYDSLNATIERWWLESWNLWPTANVFNHPLWFQVVREGFPQRSPFIVVVTYGGCALLFMSVEAAPHGFQLAGSPYMDKGAILWNPELSGGQWIEIVQNLLRKYHWLCLQEISPCAPWGSYPEAQGASKMVVHSSVTPWFKLDGLSMSAKQRHEMRRLTRVLERRGVVEFTLRRLTQHDIGIMQDIEGCSTKIQRNKAVLVNSQYRTWLGVFLEKFRENCWIAFLFLNGRPIAHYAAVCSKGRLLGLHMAFVKEYARMSPGSVLIFNILPLLEKEGIKEFDYGRGQSVMKAKFAGENSAPQVTLYYFKKTFRGQVVRFQAQLLWGLIRIGRQLRKVAGRRVTMILDRLALKR